MKRIIVYMMVAALLLSVILVGCGSVEKKVTGKWSAVSITLDGYPLSPSDIGMGSSGGDYIINADGTYESAISWEEGTWSVDGETVILKMAGSGKSTRLTYKDEQLILNNDGMTIIFEKK